MNLTMYLAAGAFFETTEAIKMKFGMRTPSIKKSIKARTTPGSDCALTSLAIDEPLEYARLYLDGNLQMWVDAEDSLEL